MDLLRFLDLVGRGRPLCPASGPEGSWVGLDGDHAGGRSLWLLSEEESNSSAPVCGSYHVVARGRPLCPAERYEGSCVGLGSDRASGRGLMMSSPNCYGGRELRL